MRTVKEWRILGVRSYRRCRHQATGRSLAASLLTVIITGTFAVPTQGQAVRFDGATGYGVAPAGSPIQDSTWESWVFLESLDPAATSLGWTVGWWGSNTGTTAGIVPNGSLSGGLGWCAAGAGAGLGPGGVTAGQWHHIAGVFGSECSPSMDLYFDGSLLASYGAGTCCPTSSVGTTLAAYNFAGWNGFFRGRLDEVRISSVPRYSSSFVPETRFTADASTWGLWHFDEGAGSVVAEEIAGRDFMLQGGYSWVSGVDCSPVLPSAEIVRLGTPPNPAGLLPGVTSGPVMGATWDPVIDHTTFLPGSLSDILAISATPTNLPSSFGTILCGATPFLVLTTSPGTPFAIPIPIQCSLTGVSLCAQGVGIDGSFSLALTNALDITLGSY